MIRFDPQARIRPTAKSKAFLDHLKEMEIFPRRVDAYAFAAAFAITQGLDYDRVQLHDRSDLVRIGLLDEQVRLTLATALHSTSERSLETSTVLLEEFTHVAEVGCECLVDKWAQKSRAQVLLHLRNSM